MESMMDEDVNKADKKTKATERICVGADESIKAQAWLDQINASSNGFMSLSKADVVNFVIREFKPELSAKEIQRIKAYHYDPIKHLNWITPRLKEALASGDAEKIASIQEEIRGIELAVIQKAGAKIANSRETASAPSRPHKKRSKKDLNATESAPIAKINEFESAQKIIL